MQSWTTWPQMSPFMFWPGILFLYQSFKVQLPGNPSSRHVSPGTSQPHAPFCKHTGLVIDSLQSSHSQAELAEWAACSPKARLEPHSCPLPRKSFVCFERQPFLSSLEGYHRPPWSHPSQLKQQRPLSWGWQRAWVLRCRHGSVGAQGKVLGSPSEVALAWSVEKISTQGGCSLALTHLSFLSYKPAVATPSALALSSSTTGSGLEQTWLSSSLGQPRSSFLIYSGGVEWTKPALEGSQELPHPLSEETLPPSSPLLILVTVTWLLPHLDGN